jgi:hypothetical protein
LLAEGLKLTYRTAERSLALAPVNDGRLQVLDGDKAIEPPADGRWGLEGDLRANAKWFRFLPPHSIFKRSEAEVLADPAQPFSSRVGAQVKEATDSVCADVAVKAVLQWKYSPAKFRGKAVAVSVTQPIIFALVD